MPSINGAYTPYADHLTKEERDQLLHSAAFDRALMEIWHKNSPRFVGELVQELRDVEKFSEEIFELHSTDPDYEEACAQNSICVVDGKDDAFYFNWGDTTTIECTNADDAMIDFKAFAQSKGIPLHKYGLDASIDDDGSLFETPNANTLADLFEHDGLANGSDVHELLRRIAEKEGMTELVAQMNSGRAQNIEKLYGDFINKDFISTQSNNDFNDACENACNENSIDVDDFRKEVLEHFAIDKDMASALQAQGEKVVEFLGLDIWCRTTSGQMVSADYCVQQAVLNYFTYSMDSLIQKEMPEVAQRIDKELAAIPATPKPTEPDATPAP